MEQVTETLAGPEKRDFLIGGSRISAVMGLSRWQSPLSLWAEMTGRVERDELANFEIMEIGAELEQFVADKFTRKTGKKLRRNRRTLVHSKYPYMVGHPDRWVDGEDALFEAKTTSAWRAKDWDGDEIPQEGLLQLSWYLGLEGRQIGYIAVLIGGNKFIWKQIEFSQKLFDRQVESARVFVEEFLLKDTPPMAGPDDSDVLLDLYPAGEGRADLSDEQADSLESLILKRSMYADEIEALEKLKDEAESKAKMIVGGFEFAETMNYVVSWKNSSTTRVDTDKLKKAGLYEEFSKTTEGRRFLPTKKKGGKTDGK